MGTVSQIWTNLAFHHYCYLTRGSPIPNRWRTKQYIFTKLIIFFNQSYFIGRVVFWSRHRITVVKVVDLNKFHYNVNNLKKNAMVTTVTGIPKKSVSPKNRRCHRFWFCFSINRWSKNNRKPNWNPNKNIRRRRPFVNVRKNHRKNCENFKQTYEVCFPRVTIYRIKFTFQKYELIYFICYPKLSL